MGVTCKDCSVGFKMGKFGDAFGFLFNFISSLGDWFLLWSNIQELIKKMGQQPKCYYSGIMELRHQFRWCR